MHMVTYDENKRILNLKKHGFDFIGCEVVFKGFMLTSKDSSAEYGEMRLQSLGLWNDVVCSWCIPLAA